MVWKKKLHARQSIIFSRQLATTITLRYDKTRRIVLLTRYKKHDSSKTITFFLSVVRFPLSRTFLFSVVHFSSRSYISPLSRTFLLSVVFSRSFFPLSRTSLQGKKVRLPQTAKTYDFHTEQKSTTYIQSINVRVHRKQESASSIQSTKKYDFHRAKSRTSIYSKKSKTFTESKKVRLPYRANKSTTIESKKMCDFHTEQKSTTSIQSKKSTRAQKARKYEFHTERKGTTPYRAK